jgi:hypothetical protein
MHDVTLQNPWPLPSQPPRIEARPTIQSLDASLRVAVASPHVELLTPGAGLLRRPAGLSKAVKTVRPDGRTLEEVATRAAFYNSASSVDARAKRTNWGQCFDQIETAYRRARLSKPLFVACWDRVLDDTIDCASHKNKIRSRKTIAQEAACVRLITQDLHRVGWDIHHRTPNQLSSTVVKKLVNAWLDVSEGGANPYGVRKLSVRSLVNEFGYVTRLFRHTGRGMELPKLAELVDDPRRIKISPLVKRDESWHAQGIDVYAFCERLVREDPRVAMVVLCCYLFALRRREALYFNPITQIVDDVRAYGSDGTGVGVVLPIGTKGGRPRVWALLCPERAQQALELREYWRGLYGAADPQEQELRGKRSLEQAQKRVHYLLSKHGISRAHGVWLHGLRKQRLMEEGQRLGAEFSVRPGQAKAWLTPAQRSLVERRLMEIAGHSDVSKGKSYYGQITNVKVDGVPQATYMRERCRINGSMKRQLFARVGAGESVAQVARDLGISTSTAYTRLRDKLIKPQSLEVRAQTRCDLDARIQAMYRAGASISAIAVELAVPSHRVYAAFGKGGLKAWKDRHGSQTKAAM